MIGGEARGSEGYRRDAKGQSDGILASSLLVRNLWGAFIRFTLVSRHLDLARKQGSACPWKLPGFPDRSGRRSGLDPRVLNRSRPSRASRIANKPGSFHAQAEPCFWAWSKCPAHWHEPNNAPHTRRWGRRLGEQRRQAVGTRGAERRLREPARREVPAHPPEASLSRRCDTGHARSPTDLQPCRGVLPVRTSFGGSRATRGPSTRKVRRPTLRWPSA